MLVHIESTPARELSNNKRSSFEKDVTTENNWIFELGVRDGIDVPIYVIAGFMRRDQFNQEHQYNDLIYTPSAVSAQCFIRSEKYPDAGINCNHAFVIYSQTNAVSFRVLDVYLKTLFYNHILQKKDFVTCNNHPDSKPAYNVIVSDNRHHQHFNTA